MARTVQVNEGQLRYVQNISVGPHSLQGDESIEVGGGDTGANPHELLLAALGTCASITVRMYADRKQWPLDGVRIDLSYAQTQDSAAGSRDVRNAEEIELNISFWGYLSDEQRTRRG